MPVEGRVPWGRYRSLQSCAEFPVEKGKPAPQVVSLCVCEGKAGEALLCLGLGLGLGPEPEPGGSSWI